MVNLEICTKFSKRIWYYKISICTCQNFLLIIFVKCFLSVSTWLNKIWNDKKHFWNNKTKAGIVLKLVYALLTLSFLKILFLNHLDSKIMYTKVVSLFSFMKLLKVVSTPLILLLLKILIVDLSFCLSFLTLRENKSISVVKVMFLSFLFISLRICKIW